MTQDSKDLNRRLESTTERLLSAFEELDFLHRLAETLANPDAIEDLDAYLLGETQQIFSADGGWVMATRPEGGFSVRAHRGMEEAVVEHLTDTLIPQLVEEDALPFLVDDLPRTLMRLRPKIGRTPEEVRATDLPRAFLAAPLVFGQEILGVIALVKHETGRPFSSGDQRLLTTLSSQAALFTKSATLMRRFQAEARTLGRKLELLEGEGRGACARVRIKGCWNEALQGRPSETWPPPAAARPQLQHRRTAGAGNGERDGG